MNPMNPSFHRGRTALALSSFALAAAFFILTGPAGAQSAGDLSVTDVTTCPVTSVNIVKTPYQVRRQEFMPADTSVLTLQGVFANIPAGVTFHVTHVSGTFFTQGAQLFHVRLYKNGSIIEGFNVGDTAFHMENSSTFVRTLNQPVDLYFPMESDPTQYDLQLVRSGTIGSATGIVEFWGYLTSDTCPGAHGQ
jgi:hypothetical protein